MLSTSTYYDDSPWIDKDGWSSELPSSHVGYPGQLLQMWVYFKSFTKQNNHPLLPPTCKWRNVQEYIIYINTFTIQYQRAASDPV